MSEGQAPKAHPYLGLAPSRYWKTAVAGHEPLDIDLGWKPRFGIDRATRTLTLGSCFAQHIGSALRRSGFGWIEAEPSPSELPEAVRAQEGYGIFSFRTGNIYTAALLRQWVCWATGREPMSTEAWVEAQRHYDPFRPSFPREGYGSAEEMLRAREETLRAIAAELKRSDLLVFTLGLTEAWVGSGGEVYPMCPGTLRGEFDAKRHHFKNYSAEEVASQVSETFEAIRAINPRMRFLLTVSPVPLVATAADEHVLVATMHSKSVLRAAAGAVRTAREDTDYFPSYELIAAPAFRGRFFAPDLRSVTNEGVAFVMRQFLGALGETAHAPAEPGTEICDEIVLQNWAGPSTTRFDPAAGTQPSAFLLLGDSHMGLVGRALDELGVSYRGGALMNGSEWHALNFTQLVQPPYLIPVEENARLRWDGLSREFFAAGPGAPGSRCIITNVGAHSRATFGAEGFRGFRGRIHPALGQSPVVDLSDVKSYVHHARTAHMNVLHGLVEAGYRVIFVVDPPTLPVDANLARLIDIVTCNMAAAVGCSVFSSWDWIERRGGFPDEFRSTEIDPSTGVLDYQHGSAAYYRALVQELAREFALPFPSAPPATTTDRRQASRP